MNLYLRIKDVAKSCGVSVSQLEKDLGFARSTINKFATSSPSIDKVQLIAEYFGVPIDYLLSDDASMDTPFDAEAYTNIMITRLTGDETVMWGKKLMTSDDRLALAGSLMKDKLRQEERNNK